MKRFTNPETRLAELGIALPPPCQAVGRYRPAIISGSLLYISGHTQDDAFPNKYLVGKVAPDRTCSCSHSANGPVFTALQAYDAARDIGLAILSTANQMLGGLNHIRQLISVTGVINSTPDFCDHPQVINGFSDLMIKVFGESRGVGTRSATGVQSLPGGVAVEITQCIFEINSGSSRVLPLARRVNKKI